MMQKAFGTVAMNFVLWLVEGPVAVSWPLSPKEDYGPCYELQMDQVMLARS